MFRKTAFVAATALILGLACSSYGDIGPRGWYTDTIGTATAGKAIAKAETFEVTGNGADIWGNADAFQFMYKELSGDGSVTARVLSKGTGTNTWAKGGVMIRNSIAAGSEHAMMVITGNSDGTAAKGAGFQWRPVADNASSGADNTGDVINTPYWVRMDRVGNDFSAFVSPDGQAWTQIGTTQTIEMADPVYIGLCVTSHADGELRTYTFGNVSMTGEVTDRPPYVKARQPDPADGFIGLTLPVFSWTPGETAVAHDVYLGTSPELTEADLVYAAQLNPAFYYGPGLDSGVQYYWRIDEIDAEGVTHTGDVWSVMGESKKAYYPTPTNGTEGVVATPTLNWNPGELAIEHHIYFSSMFTDVNDRTAAADQGTTTELYFEPGMLRSSTTYFWRVDEINSDGTIEQGPVWNFTTEAGIANKIVREWWTNITGTAITDLTGNANYPDNPTGTELLDLFEGPTDWADNYGTRMYGWLKPPETGDYTFWIAGDDLQQLWLSTDADPANAVQIANVTSWTNSREWTKEANQKSALISLEAGKKYYIEALGKEGTGGDNMAVSWLGGSIMAQEVISAKYVDAFGLPPLQAFSPTPATEAVDVSQTPVLSWNPGENSQEHLVYFGEDASSVAAADTSSPLFKGSQAETTFEPGELQWGTTYYWRVDEVDAASPDGVWKGNVWSFTTADFLTVDNFESYTDAAPDRIFDIWFDGYGDDTNGSVVGYIDAINGTFNETSIVHGGSQSMPLDYNNIDAPYISKATRDFSPAQNWTVEGVDTLSLWVRGYPAVGNVDIVESGGKMSLTGSGADIWGNSDAFTYAYKPLTGDGSISARVVSIGDGTNTWAKGGVMIRDSLNGGSTHASMDLTANTDGAAGNGASFQYRATTDGTSGNTDSGTVIAAPYWVKMERLGTTLTGYLSPDGTNWTMMGTTSIEMDAPVYIGLCVTSHDAATERTFQFDNISFTGGVSGTWKGAAISSSRHNSDEGLYLTLTDSAGKTATVTNDTAVTAADWTEVKVPLSDFAGVNPSKIAKLVIGVGNPTTPVAGGTGRIFIDDVRVVKPE